MAAEAGYAEKLLISRIMTDNIEISTANMGVFDCSQLEQSISRLWRQRPTTGNGNIVTETGNTGCVCFYLWKYERQADNIKMLKAKLGYSTTASSNMCVRTTAITTSDRK